MRGLRIIKNSNNFFFFEKNSNLVKSSLFPKVPVAQIYLIFIRQIVMSIVCHFCQKPGHKHRNCPTKRAKNVRDKAKEEIAKALGDFDMGLKIRGVKNRGLVNEEEIIDFLYQCRGRTIRVSYYTESERIFRFSVKFSQ